MYHRFLRHSKYGVVNLTKDRFISNAIWEAVPGDVIVYDWHYYEHNGHLPTDRQRLLDGFQPTHLAFVVDNKTVTKIAEWGTANWSLPGPVSTYRDRDWNWSVISNARMGIGPYPHIAAKLLHFPNLSP